MKTRYNNEHLMELFIEYFVNSLARPQFHELWSCSMRLRLDSKGVLYSDGQKLATYGAGLRKIVEVFPVKTKLAQKHKDMLLSVINNNRHKILVKEA